MENEFYTFPPPPEEKETPFVLSKKDIVFSLCAVIVGIFAMLFGIFEGFALGYLLTVVLCFGLFFAYLPKGQPRVSSVLWGVLALADAAVFICTSNGSVRFFAFILNLLLMLLCFDGLVFGSTRGNRQTLGVWRAAFSSLNNMTLSVKSLFASGNGRGKVFGKVLVSILCAVPVLIVIVPLLLASDDAFQGMMRSMFSDAPETLVKLCVGVALAVPMVSYGFSLKNRRLSKKQPGEKKGIDSIYIVTFLSVISVCYVLYLFSQLAYFFSAFRGFLPNGTITYAEYARKGFFEMCAIAVINLIIVFSSLLLAKKKNGKVGGSVQAVTTFICLFNLIIITTAISKMVLYIDAYGMTVLRLTTSAFMVFLGIVFISVILRIYSTKINILKTGLIAAGCIVMILGTANVNRICAAYNYESYRSGKLSSIDVDAIYFLGDEGIPYLIKLAEDPDEFVAGQAKRFLANECLNTYFDTSAPASSIHELEKTQTGFGCYSLPQAKAYRCLYAYYEEHFHQLGQWHY